MHNQAVGMSVPGQLLSSYDEILLTRRDRQWAGEVGMVLKQPEVAAIQPQD